MRDHFECTLNKISIVFTSIFNPKGFGKTWEWCIETQMKLRRICMKSNISHHAGIVYLFYGNWVSPSLNSANILQQRQYIRDRARKYFNVALCVQMRTVDHNKENAFEFTLSRCNTNFTTIAILSADKKKISSSKKKMKSFYRKNSNWIPMYSFSWNIFSIIIITLEPYHDSIDYYYTEKKLNVIIFLPFEHNLLKMKFAALVPLIYGYLLELARSLGANRKITPEYIHNNKVYLIASYL